jgi:replicative DNA helicase
MASTSPVPVFGAAAAPQTFDRKPPYSHEAEISVLGGMLIDPEAIVRVIEIIDDTMFYREANRRLFRAMVRLWERGDVLDRRSRSPRS